MKGTTASITIAMRLILAVVIVAVLIMLGSFVSKSAEDALVTTTPIVSASGFSTREYNICEANCDPIAKKTCTIVPCKVDTSCTTKGLEGTCCQTAGDLQRDCATIYALAENKPVPQQSSGGGGGSSTVATFDGTFLPGGKVNILLPVWLKGDTYDSTKLRVELFENDKSLEICTASALPLTPGSTCKYYFPSNKADIGASDKPQPQMVLSYGRDGNNIETKIKESSGKNSYSYRIELQQKDSGGTYRRNGSYIFSWSCPQPAISKNSAYLPGEVVEFNVTSPWMDYAVYNAGTAKVEIGARKGTTGSFCYDRDAAKWVPTCFIGIHNPVGDYKKYWFVMPYVASGQPLAISYPVYAKDKITGSQIVINGDGRIPMCRSGREDYIYTCPSSACYTDNTNNKVFLVSSYSPSGIYSTDNPACKYSVMGTECATGCREVATGSGMSAECTLPKPDIVNVFMIIDGAREYSFNAATGTYVKNSSFLITQSNHPNGRKWAIIVVKNKAPSVQTGIKPSIYAGSMSFIASLGGTNYAVSSLPAIKRYQKYEDSVLVWTNSSVEGVPVDEGTALEPGEYFEYTVDLVDSGVTEAKGVHSGTIMESITASVTVASDTIKASAFSYTVYDDSCNACTGSTQVLCESCGSRCIWNPVSGTQSFCKKRQ